MSDLNEPISWQLRTRTLTVGAIPLLMGVVNVTPDSFSDGGKFFDPAAAVEHGLRLAGEGADLIDIGGQSTRPGTLPIDADEELRRVLPVVEAIAQRVKVPISVDTFLAKVAREVLAAGAGAINDITALTGDDEMLDVVVEAQCGVCLMHMQGTPATMQKAPSYSNVCEEVAAYLAQRLDTLVRAGVNSQRVAIDPGIGFGKTIEHNLELLRHLDRLQALKQPIVVGVSRKATIGHLIGDTTIDRTFGTIGAAIAAACNGASILRVHDVAATRQALIAFEAIRQQHNK